MKNRKSSGVGKTVLFPFGLLRASHSVLKPTPGEMEHTKIQQPK